MASRLAPLWRFGFSISAGVRHRTPGLVLVRQLPFCCRDGLPRTIWKQKGTLEHAWSWTSGGLRATSTTSHQDGCGTSAEQVQYIFSRPQNPAPVWPVMGDFGGCMDLGPTGGDVCSHKLLMSIYISILSPLDPPKQNTEEAQEVAEGTSATTGTFG